MLKRPIIPVDGGSKVATIIRQRYLNLFVDECLKIYPQPKDAYDRVSTGLITALAGTVIAVCSSVPPARSCVKNNDQVICLFLGPVGREICLYSRFK